MSSNQRYQNLQRINDLTTNIQNNKHCIISADYSFDLSETIGNRPVIGGRMFEYEIPVLLNPKNPYANRNLKNNYSCKQPFWKWNCN